MDVTTGELELETGFQLHLGQICEGGEENQQWIGA